MMPPWNGNTYSWSFCRGEHRPLPGTSYKWPVMRVSMISLMSDCLIGSIISGDLATLMWHNKDNQQCSLSLVVNSGTTALVSRLSTNRLVKQSNFTKIATKSCDDCVKNRNMIGFVIFTCHMSSSYSFWANLHFILWFSCKRFGGNKHNDV